MSGESKVTEERHSEFDLPEIVKEKSQRLAFETFNASQQFDYAMSVLRSWLDQDKVPDIRPSLPIRLNGILLKDINPLAGTFRNASIRIKNSDHSPPDAIEVAQKVELMCDYVNSNWNSRSAIHLASYVLWSINWIHPFADGNGRTARILSYMILSARLKMILPGVKTIPEQISENKEAYYAALEDADAGSLMSPKLTKMEEMISRYLAEQLLSVHDHAADVEKNEARTLKVSQNLRTVDKMEILSPMSGGSSIVMNVEEFIVNSNSIDGGQKKNIFERNSVIVNAVVAILSVLITVFVSVYWSK